MFKPDAIERQIWPEILTKVSSLSGISIVAFKLVPYVTPELLKDHYQEHVETDLYPYLESGMVGKPVIPMVLRGEMAVSRARNLLGDTDPEKAAKGTIRRMYADDSCVLANEEHRIVRNIAHATKFLREAPREIGVWFKLEEIVCNLKV